MVLERKRSILLNLKDLNHNYKLALVRQSLIYQEMPFPLQDEQLVCVENTQMSEFPSGFLI